MSLGLLYRWSRTPVLRRGQVVASNGFCSPNRKQAQEDTDSRGQTAEDSQVSSLVDRFAARTMDRPDVRGVGSLGDGSLFIASATGRIPQARFEGVRVHGVKMSALRSGALSLCEERTRQAVGDLAHYWNDPHVYGIGRMLGVGEVFIVASSRTLLASVPDYLRKIHVKKHLISGLRACSLYSQFPLAADRFIPETAGMRLELAGSIGRDIPSERGVARCLALGAGHTGCVLPGNMPWPPWPVRDGGAPIFEVDGSEVGVVKDAIVAPKADAGIYELCQSHVPRRLVGRNPTLDYLPYEVELVTTQRRARGLLVSNSGDFRYPPWTDVSLLPKSCLVGDEIHVPVLELESCLYVKFDPGCGLKPGESGSILMHPQTGEAIGIAVAGSLEQDICVGVSLSSALDVLGLAWSTVEA